jgi:hypothetical protein
MWSQEKPYVCAQPYVRTQSNCCQWCSWLSMLFFPDLAAVSGLLLTAICDYGCEHVWTAALGVIFFRSPQLG